MLLFASLSFETHSCCIKDIYNASAKPKHVFASEITQLVACLHDKHDRTCVGMMH